jgi:catechol 2,3-dioxygenase
MSEYGVRPQGYRLPDRTHLGPVHLQVSDLQRSLAYYEGVVGLRVLMRSADRVALAPHDDDTVLVWLYPNAGVRPVPRGGVLGLYHFAILLPDRRFLGRFLAHLAEIGASAGTADHFVSEAVYLTDPDGLGIEVYADRPRSAWRVDGRQLYMTTEPLDVRSLVAAGENQLWTGIPAGTVMGHVHLHVGDLDEAAAFYHTGLGLDKVVWNYPGALFMSAGGYHHHLGTNTWSPGPPAAEDQARLLAWEVVVPRALDASAAARSIESAGFRVSRIAEGWSTADPWGTSIQLVSG